LLLTPKNLEAAAREVILGGRLTGKEELSDNI